MKTPMPPPMETPMVEPPCVSVSVLGATGSVGRAALQVIEQGRFQVVALCAKKDLDGLVALCRRHRPRFAALGEAHLLEPLRRALQGSETACGAGESAVLEAARMESEATVAAISGIDGLAPTLEAARRKTKLVLANKECVVAGGAWFLDVCAQHGSPVVPADSEHNAIFQILEREKTHEQTQNFTQGFDDSAEADDALESIVLTASGGPFLDLSLEELARVTRREACAHPNFSMGEKISIDSATMMNKALEIIEAARLFKVEEQVIEVLVHPQQIVHGLVVYGDGSVFALAGACDMRLPLWHALHWPRRVRSKAGSAQRLDWRAVSQLSFRALERERFPAPDLARQSLTSAIAPVVLNAANEVLVDAFLNDRIAFGDIVPLVEAVMQAYDCSALDHPNSLERVLTIDAYGRRLAHEQLLRNAVSLSLASSPLPQAASLQQA